jgi:hypothetical protein
MNANEFARHAQPLSDGTGLTTEQRLQLSLITPDAPGALTQRQAGQITANRIRSAMAELAHVNIDNVHEWLRQVAAQSPAKAVELFIELAQFSLPKLKAVAVDVRSSDGSVKSLSVSELEKIVSEQ